MNVGVIIQARTSSARLPRKVLKELPYGSGITVLQQIIRRLKRSKRLDDVIVATSMQAPDGQIAALGREENVKTFRGDLDNVLGRYYAAASEHQLDVVVRITGDCPCVDAEIVDEAVEKHVREGADYTSNVVHRSYPAGFDVEVFNFTVLEEVYRKAQDAVDQEHVTLYIHKHADEFKMEHIAAPPSLHCPQRRLTLDTAEDYVALCAVYDFLYEQDQYFGARRVINLFNEKPWLDMINANVAGKKALNTLEEELNEIVRIARLQDLKRAKVYLEEKLNHS